MKGRKQKLTRELMKRIAAILRAGHYAEVACAKVGIATTTYYRWLEEAETRGGLYREFRDTVEAASAHAETRALALIQNAKTPEHAKWFLERRFAERWGRKERVEQTMINPSKCPPPIINFTIQGEEFVPPTTAGETADQPTQAP